MKKTCFGILLFFCCFFTVHAEEVFTADMDLYKSLINSSDFSDTNKGILEAEKAGKKYAVFAKSYSSFENSSYLNFVFLILDDTKKDTKFTLKRNSDPDRDDLFWDTFYLYPDSSFKEYVIKDGKLITRYEAEGVDPSINFNDLGVLHFFNYELDGKRVQSTTMLYYTNIPFTYDFNNDVSIVFNSSFYKTQKITNKSSLKSNQYFMLKNYVDGSNIIDTPTPKISSFDNSIIDDVVNSTNIKIDFQFINDDFKYYFSKDNGLTWEEYTNSEKIYTFPLSNNTTIKAKVFNKKTQKYENEVSFNVNFIGKSSLYYENYIKNHYGSDLDGSTENITWSSGPSEFVKYYFSLLKETYPILWQIPKIISLFQYDETNSPYCHKVTTEDKWTSYSCEDLPTLKIDFLGINKEVKIFDFSLFKDKREMLFSWIKFYLALWTILSIFRNMERSFSND